jgi:NADPH-dependent F420 reductase
LDIGIIGGTGPLGSALGLRFARAGLSVGIGSRDQMKSRKVVEDLLRRWDDVGDLKPLDNDEASRAQVVVIAVPWDATISVAEPFSGILSGKVVISIANAIMKWGSEFIPVQLPRGSVCQTLQSILHDSMVVGALHHVPARDLANVGQPVDADTMVISDFASARKQVVELLSHIDGLRPVEAGSLAIAGAVEGMTAALLNVNMAYRARVSLRFAGLSA